MNSSHTVTVLCIAYNHSKWIVHSLQSVRVQDYLHVNLVVVDNGSSDNTVELIKKWTESQKSGIPIKTVFKIEQIPYCSLFNELLEEVDTDFVIDLSGDDYLLQSHISKSVRRINTYPDASFVFSDAKIVHLDGKVHGFYERNEVGVLMHKVIEGDLYEKLISRCYICSPSVMFRTCSLKAIGGYDESLTYEDFDVQLRLARKFKVLFSDHIGVSKHLHSNSLSASQYRRYQSNMLASTLKVCWKIKEMNISHSENEALKERIGFELKHALWSANFDISDGFIRLGNSIGLANFKFRIYKLWAKFRLDLSWLYAKIT